jgi:hypothetical protein
MTNQKDNTSPDGKWKVTINTDGNLTWFDLTKFKGTYTIQELVQATKDIKPEIW